ncbi:hypothetical protein [Chitinophaga sp. 212800010-3]|uniref:hypothetical protein n=1 Tax=unclassified Chitinophaga TaxID=2619133 RepID=UPI002E14C05D
MSVTATRRVVGGKLLCREIYRGVLGKTQVYFMGLYLWTGGVVPGNDVEEDAKP